MTLRSVALDAPRDRLPAIPWAALLTCALLALVAFMVLAPLTLMVTSSFQLARPGQPAVYGLDGWRQAFGDPANLAALWNTVTLSVARQSIAVVLGVLLAWLIARTDLPFKGTLEFVFWLTFFLPPLPVAVGWILLLDGRFGLVNQWLQALPGVSGPLFDIYGFWGIVWVHLTTTIGVKVLLLAPAFRNLDAALEEAARTCGVGTLGTLRRIVIPIMAPAILVATILGLIRSLDAFEIELLLGTPVRLFVYSTKIRELVTFEPPNYAAATALGTVLLVVILLLVALQRWYLAGRLYHTVTGRGFSTREMALGRWRWPTFGLVALVALTVSVVPLAVLLLGTFMRAFGYFDIPNPWTLDHWHRVLTDATLVRAFQNTLIVGGGTAVVGTLLYALIAYVIVKTRFAARGLLDLLSWLPWAISGILMGLALLWTVVQVPFLRPLYGTVQVLVLALIVKSMPLGVQLTRSVLLQLGDELEEASRMAGGSWWPTYRRVVLPLLAPTLITVGLIGFMSAARDVSTIVLLGSAQSRTLALLALDYAYGGQFERATVVSMLTVALVVVAALLVRPLGGRLGISAR
ncbi:MAG TPA: iron ABC transporter permease [Chloroflexota bacterium]|nr:iron ABC transporter permease [Chloroflexota bacterium]